MGQVPLPGSEALVAGLADAIAARAGAGVLRVGIDGVDGAGKTTLALHLAGVLRRRGHHVISASIDGFHRPRAERYARGRHSAEGFYLDSYDLAAFRRDLLDPLGPGGSRRYRTASFDHRSDRAVVVAEAEAPPDAILIVDGIFLHRPELRDAWDFSVFLDVPFAESFRRMAARDGSDPDPEASVNQRYRGGQQLYMAECDPRRAATVLVDYADPDQPRVLRGP